MFSRLLLSLFLDLGSDSDLDLDWIGLDWIGLDWIGLDWIGLINYLIG